MSIMDAAILAKVTKIETAVGGGNGGGTSGGNDTAQAAIKELTITEPGVYEANKTFADGKTYNWLTDLKHIDPSTLMKTPDGDDWYIVATFGDEELDYCPSEKVLYLYPETGRYEYDFNTHYGWVFYDKNVNQGIVPPPKLTLSLATLETQYTLDELSLFFEIGLDGYSPVNVDIPEVDIPKPVITKDSYGTRIIASETFGKNAFVKAGEQTSAILCKDLFGSSFIVDKQYMPGNSTVTIPTGSFIGNNVRIAGNVNLKAENIKKGVTIFNVEGTYERPNEPDLTPENIRSGVDIYGVVGTLVAGEKALYGNWEITHPDAMGYMLQNNMYEGKPSSVSQDINFTVMTDGGVEESFSGMTIGYVLEFDNGPDNDATWEGFRITYKTSLGTEIVVWEQNYYGETTYPSSLGENFKNVSFGKEAQCVSQAFFDVFAYYESGYDEWGGGEYEEYHCKFLGCGECEVPDIALSISGNYVVAEANGERVAEYLVTQGEPDIKPANIKKGVKIFNVTGSYEPDVELSVDGDTVIATSDDETIAEYQLPSLAAKTYTPGATAVKISKEQWLTGDQTIAGDSDLKAENIKKGVTIFNVAGTYEGASGGSAGTVTLKPGYLFDSVPIVYYDPATSEKVTQYLHRDAQEQTITIPCGTPIFIYQDLEEGYAWTSAGLSVITSISRGGDDEEVRIPVPGYSVAYCSECESNYAPLDSWFIVNHFAEYEDAEMTDHSLKIYLIGTFVISKEYAGCTFELV